MDTGTVADFKVLVISIGILRIYISCFNKISIFNTGQVFYTTNSSLLQQPGYWAEEEGGDLFTLKINNDTVSTFGRFNVKEKLMLVCNSYSWLQYSFSAVPSKHQQNKFSCRRLLVVLSPIFPKNLAKKKLSS